MHHSRRSAPQRYSRRGFGRPCRPQMPRRPCPLTEPRRRIHVSQASTIRHTARDALHLRHVFTVPENSRAEAEMESVRLDRKAQ